MSDWVAIVVWIALAIVSLVIILRFMRILLRAWIKSLDRAGAVLDSGGVEILFKVSGPGTRIPSTRLGWVAEVLDTGGLGLLIGPSSSTLSSTPTETPRVYP